MSESLYNRLQEWIATVFHFGESRRLVALALGVGLTCGLAAAALIWLLSSMGELFFGTALAGKSSYWIIAVPAVGGLMVGPIVTFLSPETKGHGVPEVMVAVAKQGGVIRPRVAVVKAIASAISIGSGGSAGREGPIVQIGSAVGSAVGQFLREPPSIVRMLVACGAAGGISASFNAPIAGVIFALEVILRDFAARAFAMVVTASVTAAVVSHSILGRKAFFHVPEHPLEHAWEMGLYVLLGLGAAVVARVFTRVLYVTEDAFEAAPLPAWLKPGLGGLMLGGLGFFWPQVFGTGHDAIEEALAGSIPLQLLGILVVAKIAATSLTLGSGGSGGVFAPSLFVGAMFGGAFANLVNMLIPAANVQAGAYALVGMGAVFAGASFAPITAVLIIFEMTHDYALILPLMASCVVSVLLSYRINPDSIYTMKLTRRGVILKSRGEFDSLSGIRVASVMSTKVESLGQEMPFRALVAHVGESPHSGFPIIDRESRLVGLITYRELRAAHEGGFDIPGLITADVMRTKPPVCRPSDSLSRVARSMRHHNVDRMPVVSEDDSQRLLGIITEHDLVKAMGGEAVTSSGIWTTTETGKPPT